MLLFFNVNVDADARGSAIALPRLHPGKLKRTNKAKVIYLLFFFFFFHSWGIKNV